MFERFTSCCAVLYGRGIAGRISHSWPFLPELQAPCHQAATGDAWPLHDQVVVEGVTVSVETLLVGAGRGRIPWLRAVGDHRREWTVRGRVPPIPAYPSETWRGNRWRRARGPEGGPVKVAGGRWAGYCDKCDTV